MAGMIKGFLGFEILDFGILGVRKVLASNLFFVLHHLMLSGNFYGSEIRHGILWGLNVGPGIFLGFCLKPKRFLSVDFCPHSNIPVT